MAGGELVKIGARRGALAVWGTIIRLLANSSIPARVAEQILTDILGNMVDDILEGSKGDEGELIDLSRYGFVEGNVRLTVPSEAKGIRWEGGIPGTYGKWFGGENGVPVYYGDNERYDRPGFLFFSKGENSYGNVSVAFRKQVVPFPILPSPQYVDFVLNVGVTLEVWWLKKK